VLRVTLTFINLLGSGTGQTRRLDVQRNRELLSFRNFDHDSPGHDNIWGKHLVAGLGRLTGLNVWFSQALGVP